MSHSKGSGYGCSLFAVSLGAAPGTDVTSNDDLAKVTPTTGSFQIRRKESRSKDGRGSLKLSYWVPLGAICTQHINQAQGLSSYDKCHLPVHQHAELWHPVIGFVNNVPHKSNKHFLLGAAEGPSPDLALNLKAGWRHFRLLTECNRAVTWALSEGPGALPTTDEDLPSLEVLSFLGVLVFQKWLY